MKFELKPYNRNTSDKNLLDDIKRVATELGLNSLSQKDYKKYGKYSCDTMTRRFGSWINTMNLAGLEVGNYSKITNDELLNDLKKAANQLNKKSITQLEYKTSGKYSPDAFTDHFGSWFLALEKAGLEKTHNINISIEDLFENLEEVWTKLGRQPNYAEVAKPFSRYSKDVYSRRFGSWRKALEAFVKNVNENEHSNLIEKVEPTIQKIGVAIETVQHKTTRNINWRLRFLVMKRDSFKCQKCGRSPSSEPTTILHIDHKKPYSKGGETVLENLETLCIVCNIGKSDLE